MAADKLRVAVIGAGGAGLCAAHHVLDQPHVFSAPVVFESSDQIGGTWVYTEETGIGKDGIPIHSSMYRDMRSNLPKDIMAFPDYPFPSGPPSFLHHSQVLSYLENYADHFRIKEHIKLRCLVERVAPAPGPRGEDLTSTAWDITVRCLEDRGVRMKQRFDVIFVCNGHYFDPYIPPIPGADLFQGLILHSHAYRCPEPFADKTVVVLGAGSSGIDIAVEVSSVAKLVILSHGEPCLKNSLPPNLLQATTVLNCSSTSITFHDGSVHPADALIYCTGYNYQFPFLWQSLGMQTDGTALPLLYKHLIHPSFPTLFFIGLCTQVCPFILFSCQVRYCLAVLEGKCRLPPQAIMVSKVKEEHERLLVTGQKPKYFLKLGSLQWGYFHQLAEEGGFPHIPSVIQKIYEAVSLWREVQVDKYKDINLRLLSDEDWEIVEG